MKKVIYVLLLVLLLSGCTAVRINTESLDNMVDVILSKSNKLYNRIGKGYKYYVPRGVSYIDTDGFNEKLYSDGINYYLYVDAISFYNDIDIKYKENKNAYFSKKIDNNGKKGYVEILELEDNNYFVKFIYNHSKIEVIAPKEELNDIILNSSYILSTVKFNKDIIKLMLNEDYFTNKEEKWDLFQTDNHNDNFLEIVEKEK